MTKRIWILTVFIVVLVAIVYLSIPNKQERLMADMVKLDRVYIPTLSMTSQKRLEASRKAMARLNPVWEEFKSDNQGMSKYDSEWQSDMSRIDSCIGEASRIIESGDDLLNAHEELEHVRVIMMQARERNHIGYFIDGLTRFHEPMEKLVQTVKDKQPNEITDEVLVKMRTDLKTAEYLWDQVVQSQFDKNVFGFGDEKTEKLRILVQKESDALSTLEATLSSGNTEAIKQAGVAIKPPYANLFMLFGNFDLDD